MLYVQEKVVKLGGIYLEGQVTSVEVQEAGSVYVAQDEKGRYKKSQPVGYENAKVMIDILLEDTKTATTLEQLTEMQRLFKPYGQDKPKLLPIVNEDCAVRGITRGEMNTLYRDSIIQVLSTKIDNYRKTDILQPSDDMVLEQDKVIMAGDINVTVRNVVQSVRGKE